MIAPKISTKIDSPQKFPDIFDISQVWNIELFKKIIKNHRVDLYFLWRIGVKDIEKGKIDSSFPDWNRNHVKIQVHTNLTQIRLKNKTIYLLAPLDRDYEPKLHDIESKKFRLSKLGKKIWTEAREDGLWHIFSQIPISHRLDFSKFEAHFRSHTFPSHLKYMERIKDLSYSPPKEEKRTPKRRRKEERNQSNFYAPREKNYLNHKTHQKKITFSSTDVVNKLLKYITDKSGGRMGSSVLYKTFLHYYRDSLDLPRLGKARNKIFLTSLDKFMHILELCGYVDIKFIKIRDTIIKHVSVASGSTQYSEEFFQDSRKSKSELKRSYINFSFVFSKLITILLWIVLLFILVPVQEVWYQSQYYTPISLLYTYFSKLQLFIIISSAIYALFFVSLIHLILFVKLIRRERRVSKGITAYWKMIAIITSCIFIANLIFLFGV